MVQHARGPVERDDSAHDEECGRDDAERVPVREPDGQDAASELPRRGVEGVGEPVGYQGAHGPFSIVAADGVEVCGFRLDWIVGWVGGWMGGDGGRGGLPLLLHLLAPTAPENTEGTCSTRREGLWNLRRRNVVLDIIFGGKLVSAGSFKEWGIF